ncbi:hypothetical protein [Streptomyces sp. BP-8]|uniref:HEAT repeat domain-containing protein n=1 Tax=Streptomyces sirii TaxID=3127701 RepID=A0ABZ2QEJ0_9ACTN
MSSSPGTGTAHSTTPSCRPREDDYRFQQEAAWALSIGERFYDHRALLEDLDASWPDDERGFETGTGAGHASALDVLALLAEPEDAMPLTVALRRRDVEALVRERALRAAQDCLDRWEEPEARVVAALEELIFDPSAAMDDRTLAVIALFDVPGPQVTAVLLRAAHSHVLPVQVEGALGLTYGHLIDQHRDLVRGLVASWPDGDDEPDRAWLVRQALRD